MAFEANFDGLVGPTHNYSALSYGNLASMSHKGAVSNPREAALQGLTKAKALADLGLKQGILPPQERPDIATLIRLGFGGDDGLSSISATSAPIGERREAEILARAAKTAPTLLAAASSASSMWTANAATVSPSADTADGKVHFTAANLNQKFHRAIESDTTTRALQAIFKDERYFVHHRALPHSDALGDEGAANHTRFCADYGMPGLEFFVYGREALANSSDRETVPSRFPARQTLEASRSIARLHGLHGDDTVFARQSPRCIDAGAFHNDVVSVGNQNVFFYHEEAFLDAGGLLADLRERFARRTGGAELIGIGVSSRSVPLDDAVRSYLFNSQLVTIGDQHGSSEKLMTLIAPRECEEIASVRRYLSDLVADARTPIRKVMHFDLRQSMRNGGGPACLRLRVILTAKELAHTNRGALLTDDLFARLKVWVEKHYRDRLTPNDLEDPHLLQESRTALDELTQIMELGSIYPFQT